MAIVFALALALRLAVVLCSRGGPLGNFGYDGGVYYASADAVTFGRLPYDDFVLLHPPGITLALTPFAALGRLTTDHTGFVVATGAFAVLGAVNAVLVVRIARRLRLSRAAAVAGGLFYAVWLGSVSAEYSIRLEPLGSCAFLCGLLAVFGAPGRVATGRRYGLFLGGLAFGVAASVKIWWIVPVLIVLGWQWAQQPARRAAELTAGVVSGLVAINAVFFVNAPAAMVRMVVLDQLGRPRGKESMAHRATDLLSLGPALRGAGRPVQLLVLLALTALALVIGAAAWRVTRARVLVVVLAAQLAVLLFAPSYFSFYRDYAAACASLVLAAAADRGFRNRKAWYAVALVGGCVVAAGAVTALMLARRDTAVAPFPGSRLAAGVRTSRCVMADSPMALIELDALSRDFGNGCRDWVDVTGRTYDADAPTGSRPIARVENVRWQRDLRRYLLSGDAVILIRSGTGAAPSTKQAVNAHPVLRASDGYTVYRTGPSRGLAGG